MTASRTPSDDLRTVFAGLSLIWLGFTAQVLALLLAGFDLVPLFGVMPREPWGLIGIFTAPLLHAGWDHLLANTIALTILGYLARRTAPAGSGLAVGLAMAVGGTLAWITGLPGLPHIGASGVAFGLIGFLLLNGLVRGGCGPLIVTLLVGLLFGGAILTVLQPVSSEGARLSWQMHAGGLVGGVIAAWSARERPAD